MFSHTSEFHVNRDCRWWRGEKGHKKPQHQFLSLGHHGTFVEEFFLPNELRRMRREQRCEEVRPLLRQFFDGREVQ